MADNDHPRFTIVGGGPVGALTALYLGQTGYSVDVYEMRGDPRKTGGVRGKSINLALSHRGIAALERVGLAETVLSQAVPMPGRMIHAIDGHLTFQRYGRDDNQAINSVSRGGLNELLLEAAGRLDTVRVHFNKRCTDIDLETGRLGFIDTDTDESIAVDAGIVVGTDGAFSVVRRSMQRLDRFDYRQDYLKHGYKELTIPAGADGAFAMEKNALHIWPRRSLMMIALPNIDGTFTCTLFWPFEGPESFAAIDNEDALRSFFDRQFPDAVPLMPALAQDFFANPIGSLVTVRCSPWYYRDKVVLLGDACHAVVPFYGQGMNAGFEDLLVLAECMERHKPDWRRVFERYHALRKANVDTLADLALSNFIEMRDRTGSRAFLLKKKTERMLHRLFPRWYLPLYTMATFTRTPYTEAVRRAKTQDRVVRWAAAVLIVFVVLLLVGLLR